MRGNSQFNIRKWVVQVSIQNFYWKKKLFWFVLVWVVIVTIILWFPFFENEVFKQTNALNHQYFGSDFRLLHTRFCHRLCSVAFCLPVWVMWISCKMGCFDCIKFFKQTRLELVTILSHIFHIWHFLCRFVWPVVVFCSLCHTYSPTKWVCMINNWYALNVFVSIGVYGFVCSSLEFIT